MRIKISIEKPNKDKGKEQIASQAQGQVAGSEPIVGSGSAVGPGPVTGQAPVVEETKAELRAKRRAERKAQNALKKRAKAEGKEKAAAAKYSGAATAAASSDGSQSSFAASVRTQTPFLRVPDSQKSSSRKRDFLSGLTMGLLLLSFFSIFFLIIEQPQLILFSIPVLIVYTALAMVESFDKKKAKYISCAVIAVFLIACAIIWHSEIGAGLANLVNQFYDVCESQQSYVYDYYDSGYEAEDIDIYIAIVWFSILVGMLISLFPASWRRGVAMVLTIAVMLALAYYGVIPSWVSIGVMLLALLILMPRGNMLASLPLILVAALLFGTIVLVDPGESIAVSRFDENARDRIAFRTSLLMSGFDSQYDMQDQEFLDQEDEYDTEEGFLTEESRGYVLIIVIALVVLALLAALYFFVIRRMIKRRAEVRRGIDSTDPREAVTAMFPYSVRWLKAAGTDPGNRPFSSITNDVAAAYPADYSGNYGKMCELWRMAAYSDHDISEADRNAMNSFMHYTIELASSKWNVWKKLRMKIKYAL